jgi:N-acyl-D-aspartate/D-glutamate deacylase
MSQFGLIIRGDTIVNDSGAAPSEADVAISGGRIGESSVRTGA